MRAASVPDVRRERPEIVKDWQTWADLQELDDLGEDLTQWEIDFVESLTQQLLAGHMATGQQIAKLEQVREDRIK